MISLQAAMTLLTPGMPPDAEAERAIRHLGFEDETAALERFQSLCLSSAEREQCAAALPGLLHSLIEAATPGGSLLNFQRFVQSVPNRLTLFQRLAQQPRSVEILVRLFVGSQFLTEILLRNPHYLDELTEHKRISEFKSREDYIEQGRQQIPAGAGIDELMTCLRTVQQWELLRLAACDTFGLMDLKTVTLQLSLLAEGLMELALVHLANMFEVDLSSFTILAFGKLGGEELNYSSDVDLVFVADHAAERYWTLAQRLVKTLSDATDAGFLYRVDLRLRPWGDAGPLVTTVDAYLNYMRQHGRAWEKQALLKARPVAGNRDVGRKLLKRLEPLVFDVDPGMARQNVREMKDKIETQLKRRGQTWGEVKAGPGGIRDIEFVTQFLQLTHGARSPYIRSINTLEGLVRLADYELIFPDEYRRLTGGYVFLRTVEHALQLMHNQQEHLLPGQQRELAYLARRLDFPDAETFVRQYDQHTLAVREVFESYLHHDTHPLLAEQTQPASADAHFGTAAQGYHEVFSAEDERLHLSLLEELRVGQLVRLHVAPPSDAGHLRVTIVGFDQLGELAAICGLLFAYGFDIVGGNVFTGADVEESRLSPTPGRASSRNKKRRRRKFVNVFDVRASGNPQTKREDLDWRQLEGELNELLSLAEREGVPAMQGRLARRVANDVALDSNETPTLPIQIDVDDTDGPDSVLLLIRGEDTPGFLYELTNAIAIRGLSVSRMTIRTSGRQVIDSLRVALDASQRLDSTERINELRAAIVIIKQFTHLLPQSPDPAAALIHFQEFVETLFQFPNWYEQLSPLQDSEVLRGLATLLGVSDFLWEDFLRMQYAALFPVITNVEGLQLPRSQAELRTELAEDLSTAESATRTWRLNEFKDREMVRVDMRHILGLQERFGMFSQELTDVAEVVVDGAVTICLDELTRLHGTPQTASGPARLAVCALGKFGGSELGYASDIELMFVYDDDGQTTGPAVTSNLEFYERLVTRFRRTIQSKRKGIFEVDLRLRPYGKAGSLAVSRASFENYFGPTGAAWPFERQALVKLRPVAGSTEFGNELVKLRDRLIYRGEPFDAAAMRAMREKQLRQLVSAGSFNAKLSPGGLVDCEYVVQGLQITFGHLQASIRQPNTREAMKALEESGILTGETRVRLRDAYRFWRRVIDALRMVRGDASDLTVPSPDSEEFLYLARRLGWSSDVERLKQDLERHTANVLEVAALLDTLVRATPNISGSADEAPG